MPTTRLPTYFVSHGGGPWPWMKKEAGNRYDNLEASLKRIIGEVGNAPKAVLIVTGHWEAPTWTLSSGAKPGMIYDYGGFPAHTYQIQYGAPGSPELANRVRSLLTEQGFDIDLDPERGYDHGTFTVMQPMYPDAKMPLVQMSLRDDYDAAAHLAIGRALAPLRDEGVLIIGSGLSYHNLRQFGPAGAQSSQKFDAWLQQTLLNTAPTQRSSAVIRWDEAPSARLAHPQEDHLIPLMVALGAAENETAACVYHEDFMGSIRVSSFRFGEAPAH